MASKRKLRRVSASYRDAVERVYDRRSADLPINSVVAPDEVTDPAGDKIIVTRSLRDDPVGAMFCHRHIDAAQLAAARHWQACHEAVEISGARAIDTTKEAVDGGIMPEPITEKMRKAALDLERAAHKLGAHREAIIRDILGDGMTLILAAAKRGMTAERQLTAFGREFKLSLEVLAEVYGYAMRARS